MSWDSLAQTVADAQCEQHRAHVIIGATRWTVVVHLGRTVARIYRDERHYADATWEPRHSDCVITPPSPPAPGSDIPPLVLRQLERELWAVLQEDKT
jgi:cob(I)alamin adenosyltransferase